VVLYFVCICLKEPVWFYDEGITNVGLPAKVRVLVLKGPSMFVTVVERCVRTSNICERGHFEEHSPLYR
jgi:hypothetical protein